MNKSEAQVWETTEEELQWEAQEKKRGK